MIETLKICKILNGIKKVYTIINCNHFYHQELLADALPYPPLDDPYELLLP